MNAIVPTGDDQFLQERLLLVQTEEELSVVIHSLIDTIQEQGQVIPGQPTEERANVRLSGHRAGHDEYLVAVITFRVVHLDVLDPGGEGHGLPHSFLDLGGLAERTEIEVYHAHTMAIVPSSLNSFPSTATDHPVLVVTDQHLPVTAKVSIQFDVARVRVQYRCIGQLGRGGQNEQVLQADHVNDPRR